MDYPQIIPFISPYQDGAFSEETLHKVINQHLQRPLSDELWRRFNEAFTYYWNVEAGLNGVISPDLMADSIYRQFTEHGYLASYKYLYDLCDTIWDFLEEIPGVILPY